MQTPGKIYRILIRAYPSPFHERYAKEMIQLFNDQLRQARAERRIVRHWLRTLADWSRSVLAEHAAEFRRPQSAARAPRRRLSISRALIFAPNIPIAIFIAAGMLAWRSVSYLRNPSRSQPGIA